MIRICRQPDSGCMTVITGVRTLNMGGIFIIRMTAGAGTGYRQVVHGRRQPPIGCMAVIAGVGALDMRHTLIIRMTAGAGTGY